MPILFEQFDTTSSNLISDLCTKIASHPDWDEVTVVWPSTTLTVAGATSTTTFTVASTAGMIVGQRIKIMRNGTDPYWRLVTAVPSSTTVTVDSSLGVSSSITTTTFAPEGRVLRATTSRGALMAVDLQAGTPTTELTRLSVRFWKTFPVADYVNVNPAHSLDKSVFWRATGGSTSQVLHVALSVSKEHLFIGIEGPRAYEASAVSSTYGSMKSYLFMSDLVPYHAADTVPSVVVHAGASTTAPASVTNSSFLAYLSSDSTNTVAWDPCKLGTVAFPTIYNQDNVILEPKCSIDGKHYLFPYVAFSEKEGMRGRLARFFNSGSSYSAYFGDVSTSSGELVTFDGIVYKLLTVNAGDGSNTAYGAFGASSNSGSRPTISVVVAVPYSDAV